MNPLYPYYPFKTIRPTRGTGRSLRGLIETGAKIGSARPLAPARLTYLLVLRTVHRPTPASHRSSDTDRVKTLSA